MKPETVRQTSFIQYGGQKAGSTNRLLLDYSVEAEWQTNERTNGTYGIDELSNVLIVDEDVSSTSDSERDVTIGRNLEDQIAIDATDARPVRVLATDRRTDI